MTIDRRRTQLADVKLIGPSLLLVTIREGRNRQVRKMCETIGHPVTELKRVAIGPLRDGKLKPGYWRELLPEEVERLRKASALTHDKASAPTHHKGHKGHQGTRPR